MLASCIVARIIKNKSIQERYIHIKMNTVLLKLRFLELLNGVLLSLVTDQSDDSSLNIERT